MECVIYHTVAGNVMDDRKNWIELGLNSDERLQSSGLT